MSNNESLSFATVSAELVKRGLFMKIGWVGSDRNWVVALFDRADGQNVRTKVAQAEDVDSAVAFWTAIRKADAGETVDG